MSLSDGSNANPASAGRRRSSPFLVIAAALLVFAAIAGAVFLLWRPTTLRIPVGLTLIPTAGSVESLGLLAAGETDLAVGRADEDMPSTAGSVAILRKN